MTDEMKPEVAATEPPAPAPDLAELAARAAQAEDYVRARLHEVGQHGILALFEQYVATRHAEFEQQVRDIQAAHQGNAQ